MSSEFTPETERQRLQYLVRDLKSVPAECCPVVCLQELLGNISEQIASLRPNVFCAVVYNASVWYLCACE